MRQVVLDTETTGLDPLQGHRIIELGCVELINRRITGRTYHQYICPEKTIDPAAVEVHGITNEFLADKPVFRNIMDEFVEFIEGAELVIHNAPFDVAFINAEFQRVNSNSTPLRERCSVLDTLELARRLHPGQKNSLDALCKRYDIDNSGRDLHGALLDARILVDVYLAMTGGQVSLSLMSHSDSQDKDLNNIVPLPATRRAVRVIRASAEEKQDHQSWLVEIDKVCGGNCVWLKRT